MMTTDEWVAALNALGAELDDYCATVHPAVWANDPHIQKMQARYRKLAKQLTEDRRQLALLAEAEQ